MRPTLLFSTVLAVAALTSTRARADEIVLTGADGRSAGQRLGDVTIVRIDGSDVVFRTAAGADSRRPLSRVYRLALTNDASFTAGEEAYAVGNVEAAIDAYSKAIRTNDLWKTRRVAPRLIDVATRAKRFDAALAGFIAYAKADPAAASASKPTLPARGSALLDEAARQLDAAARAATDERERGVLLSLALDVQLTRNDQVAADAIAAQLQKLGVASGGDPKLTTLTADVRLGQARIAVRAKRFADVAKIIDELGPTLVDPRQQAEALFLLAEAQLGPTAPSDRAARLDAATAFMRVVAHFNENEASPFVGQAMLRAAELLAEQDDGEGARRLCAQIAVEIPNTPVAASAATLLKRLDAAATSTR